MANQLPSDQMATPKTDAKAFTANFKWGIYPGRDEYVSADFARAQERRIAELQTAIRNITCRLLPNEPGMDMRFTRIDIERLEALLK